MLIFDRYKKNLNNDVFSNVNNGDLKERIFVVKIGNFLKN